MAQKDIILTISGKDKAIEEITRHITTLAGLCNLKVEVATQSTLDLKKENAAIHKQCFMEQKKLTVLMRIIYKNNPDLYPEICTWDNKKFDDLYAEPPEGVVR